jgi:DNA-binding Xre family transcriptional regulator
MKLRFNIKEAAENRGIMNPYQLQVAAGLSPTNASRLYNNQISQISIKTLNKLCNAFKCEPNDLFTVEKSDNKL